MNKLLSISLLFLIIIFSFVTFAYSNALTDNEPLLGFYTVSIKQDINKQDIDMIAGSPFKYLLPYGTDLRDEVFLEEYLNYAKKKGINIIFSLTALYRTSTWYPKTHWCPTASESELVSCIVRRFKDYESVYGWYLADEPTGFIGLRNKEKLKTNAEIIKKLSSKPIFAEDYPLPKGELWDYMSEFSDVFMATSYPVPERSLDEAYINVKSLTSKYNKPVIAVLQVFGKYQYPYYKRDVITGRFPTINEIKVMSYLSLMAGAKGILYFSLNDIKKLPNSKMILDSLKKLAEELKETYGVIASNENISGDYKLNTEEGVFVEIKHRAGRDYFIAVNSTNKNKSIEIFQKNKNSILRKIDLTPMEIKTLPLK